MVFWQNGTAINMLYRRSKKQIRGFTLIELLVSITVFVVIAVLTTSTLVLLSQVNREILARKELMDNATTILDSISLRARDVTQEKRILCSFPAEEIDYEDITPASHAGCPLGTSNIAFLSGLPAYFYYYQYDDVGKNLNYLRSSIFKDNPSMGQNLNSLGVKIDEARFYVTRVLPATFYNDDNMKPNHDSQYLTVSLVLSKMVGSKKFSLPIQASITTRW